MIVGMILIKYFAFQLTVKDLHRVLSDVRQLLCRDFPDMEWRSAPVSWLQHKGPVLPGRHGSDGGGGRLVPGWI